MSRWRTCCKWMNWMPSQICRMKMAQARSVRTKSSSITRSKSSPPSMLGSSAGRKKGKCKRKQTSRDVLGVYTAGSAVSTQSLSFRPPFPRNKKQQQQKSGEKKKEVDKRRKKPLPTTDEVAFSLSFFLSLYLFIYLAKVPLVQHRTSPPPPILLQHRQTRETIVIVA